MRAQGGNGLWSVEAIGKQGDFQCKQGGAGEPTQSSAVAERATAPYCIIGRQRVGAQNL